MRYRTDFCLQLKRVQVELRLTKHEWQQKQKEKTFKITRTFDTRTRNTRRWLALLFVAPLKQHKHSFEFIPLMTNAFFFLFVKRNNKQLYHPIDWWSSSDEFPVLCVCVCVCLAIEYKRKTLRQSSIRPRLQSKINLRNSLRFWYREMNRSRIHLRVCTQLNLVISFDGLQWILSIRQMEPIASFVCKRKSQPNPISKIDWSMAILSGHAINFHKNNTNKHDGPPHRITQFHFAEWAIVLWMLLTFWSICVACFSPFTTEQHKNLMISRETNCVTIRQYSLARAVNVSACVCVCVLAVIA